MPKKGRDGFFGSEYLLLGLFMGTKLERVEIFKKRKDLDEPSIFLTGLLFSPQNPSLAAIRVSILMGARSAFSPYYTALSLKRLQSKNVPEIYASTEFSLHPLFRDAAEGINNPV